MRRSWVSVKRHRGGGREGDGEGRGRKRERPKGLSRERGREEACGSLREGQEEEEGGKRRGVEGLGGGRRRRGGGGPGVWEDNCLEVEGGSRRRAKRKRINDHLARCRGRKRR